MPGHDGASTGRGGQGVIPLHPTPASKLVEEKSLSCLSALSVLRVWQNLLLHLMVSEGRRRNLFLCQSMFCSSLHYYKSLYSAVVHE